MLPTSGAQRKLLVAFIYRREILGLKSQSSSKCLTHPTRDELFIYSTWLRLAPFLPRWGPRVVSTLPNQTVTYQRNNQDKTNNIVRLKQTFQSNRSDPFTFRPKFWLLLSKEGFFLEMERQVKVRLDWPVKAKHHFWRWTTLTGKFPHWTNRSIY